MTNSTLDPALNKIFCLIGPSGTGKDSIAQLIPLKQIVSLRTREKRKNEVNGVHGNFISTDEFMELKNKNLLLAETLYAGNYYGITQGEIIDLEDAPLLYVVDWNGVESLRKNISKVNGYNQEQIVTIFIHTCRQELESRMKKRENDKEVIRARLDRADLDYAISSRCDYVVLNPNSEIEKAACEVMSIILKETYK